MKTYAISDPSTRPAFVIIDDVRFVETYRERIVNGRKSCEYRSESDAIWVEDFTEVKR